MARTRTYNHTRFDGGMTDNIRDTRDLTKAAYISHFDIYRDPTQMYVLPGYVDDMNDGSTATGMKQYDIRALKYLVGGIYAIGTLSDGTGSKLFTKATPTTASWSAVSGAEGTDDLAAYTFLNGTSSTNLYWVTIDGASNVNASYWNGVSVTDSYQQIVVAGTPRDYVMSTPKVFNDGIYATKGGIATGISQMNGATFTVNAKSTSLFGADVASGNEQVGIFGFRTFPRRAQLLLWDSASLLIDQKVEFGTGEGRAVGFPSGYWVGVVSEGLDVRGSTPASDESNDTPSMAIKVASGPSAEKLYRIYGATTTNAVIRSSGGGLFYDSMLFYARIPTDATPTTYREGMWAVGKAQIDSPLAVSVPFDTSSLGVVNAYHNFGQHHFFVHADDGSISRLDEPDGTYDVPAKVETLVYGADTPFLKEFNGVSVITENLPSGASVEVSYRKDTDDSWTTLGTSSTTGDQIHTFTRVSGVPIGRFREIQFRITATGKVVLKSYHVSITETDDLPYNL